MLCRSSRALKCANFNIITEECNIKEEERIGCHYRYITDKPLKTKRNERLLDCTGKRLKIEED